jgi:hypothetical protein
MIFGNIVWDGFWEHCLGFVGLVKGNPDRDIKCFHP